MNDEQSLRNEARKMHFMRSHFVDSLSVFHISMQQLPIVHSSDMLIIRVLFARNDYIDENIASVTDTS